MGAAILLRPDGGLLLIAIELYLAMLLFRTWRRKTPAEATAPRGLSAAQLLRAGLFLALVSLAPLVPWAWRNLHTLDRFQPLAPRYANEEDEFVPAGFNRWVKTWIADFSSVEEIYWSVPGSRVDADKLPGRAFDSEAQREQTEQLLADYNEDAARHSGDWMPALRRWPTQRIQHSRLRYYVWLPLLRVTGMWLRPRTEILPSDTRWWEFNDDPKWSVLAVTFGLIGLGYVGLAVAGLLNLRAINFVGLLLTFVVLRSVFLSGLENPEPRYTLGMLPGRDPVWPQVSWPRHNTCG